MRAHIPLAFFLDRSEAFRLLFPSVQDPCFTMACITDRGWSGHLGPDGESEVTVESQARVGDGRERGETSEAHLNITCAMEGAEQ